MDGTIKYKNEEKGYGFITPDGKKKDIFFHFTGLNGVDITELKQGDRVTYDPVDTERGPKATNIVRVK